MCKGYVAHFASIDVEFADTPSSGSSDGNIELTTTKEVPAVQPKHGSKEVDASGSKQGNVPTPPPTAQSSIVPDIKLLRRRRSWDEPSPVTLAPFRESFSVGSFQLAFNVTQSMSPSCRMLVYYVRNRETIADSKVFDIEDSFANKVSKPICHVHNGH